MITTLTIRKAIDQHIADSGLVTAPERLIERIIEASTPRPYDPPRKIGLKQRRTGPRSVSSKWQCNNCFQEFRTPNFIAGEAVRSCKCSRHYFLSSYHLGRGAIKYVRSQIKE